MILEQKLMMAWFLVNYQFKLAKPKIKVVTISDFAEYHILFIIFTFSHLADAFIQSNLQMRTMEAIKINKRAKIRKCYNKSQLA